MKKKLEVNFKSGRTTRIRIRCGRVRYALAAIGLIIASGGAANNRPAEAAGCPDVRIVFARGSGGERWVDQNYLEFKSTIQSKLETTDLSYEFIDLDYPAVGVGIDNLGTTIGAYIGSGEAYEFGKSISKGVTNLLKMVNGRTCPETKYVVGGYSQGAIVISKSLPDLASDRLIYAATFGDPKIYLPEGAGVMPAACRGENLSDYRMYVPDCQAYKGLLGAYVPYEPTWLAGKVGTWCNKRDILCSSHVSIGDHTAYIADNLYEDASRVIFDKITRAFDIENHISSPHDTVILIDSTGSMRGMISQYKKEAFRLAKETLESGGRVALYDYRDLDDPYEARQHCNFETCTLERFADELDGITTDGGGDTPESLLSSAFKAMNELEWRYGSTKSLVILTDANFLSPDRDGIRAEQVVALSKTIDPVNFYIITEERYADDYEELARQTDGLVVTDLDRLSLLTDYIMRRYDSLPRVEEEELAEQPRITISGVEWINEDTAKVEFENTGTGALVILNDAMLGVTRENTVEIGELSREVDNFIRLVPLGEEVRGEGVTVRLSRFGEDWEEVDGERGEEGVVDDGNDGGNGDDNDEDSVDREENDKGSFSDEGEEGGLDKIEEQDKAKKTIIPKAPNTGRK